MPRSTDSQSKESSFEQKYANARNKRQKHVDTILNSPSQKKIVVAGPGTGKTYLFKEILKGKTNALTLTFVNSLVEDLSLDLCGLSDVRTLHGFARSALSTTTRKVKLFPKLSMVIEEDARVLLNKEINFDKLFHDREDESEHIKFYKQRKDYYGYYGYSDIVFALVKHFEKSPSKIPTYEQVVVDEFQDFNKLEVSLIDLLAQKSPVLLAGDDDQALYVFKSASPEHIRKRYGNVTGDYASFTLPYCSRCTRVVVGAVNDVIDAAKRSGYLGQRINKAYQYFEERRKTRRAT
jgi:ATP-dependent exoDNAse (exonuclease V) beta subunit